MNVRNNYKDDNYSVKDYNRIYIDHAQLLSTKLFNWALVFSMR